MERMEGPEDKVPDGFVACDWFDGQFADLVGPLWVRRDAEADLYGFRVEVRHCNARGSIHGGMLMTFADQVLGLAVTRSVGPVPIATISLNSDFVAGAGPGDWLIGRGEIIRRTRSLAFVRGSLCRGDEVVLSASGVWRHFSS